MVYIIIHISYIDYILYILQMGAHCPLPAILTSCCHLPEATAVPWDLAVGWLWAGCQWILHRAKQYFLGKIALEKWGRTDGHRLFWNVNPSVRYVEEGWREIRTRGVEWVQPVQPEQCFIHGARSQANCVTEKLSTLQLVPCSLLGTENGESGVLTSQVALEAERFTQ